MIVFASQPEDHGSDAIITAGDVHLIMSEHLAASGQCRGLQTDGLVRRVQYPETPVRVEYSVTDECAKLVPVFEIIGQWSREKLMLSYD